jgi:hypothetical protein
MPYLGDFLGHLLSEIIIARAQADAEAIRIAEVYAKDPLLRHFPVPRFRLPNLTVRVPVAVSEMEEAAPGEARRGKIELAKAKTSFSQIFSEELKRSKITLSKETLTGVKQHVERQFKEAALTIEDMSARRLADIVIITIKEVFSDHMAEESENQIKKLDDFIHNLRKRLVEEFQKLRLQPPRLRVFVTATELREIGESLVNLELSISEDAIEWTIIESDGKYKDRLVPE